MHAKRNACLHAFYNFGIFENKAGIGNGSNDLRPCHSTLSGHNKKSRGAFYQKLLKGVYYL